MKMLSVLVISSVTFLSYASEPKAISQDVYELLADMQELHNQYIFERNGGTEGLMLDLGNCLSACRTGPHNGPSDTASIVKRCMALRGWNEVHINENLH